MARITQPGHFLNYRANGLNRVALGYQNLVLDYRRPRRAASATTSLAFAA
jgi:hypothetical protein